MLADFHYDYFLYSTWNAFFSHMKLQINRTFSQQTFFSVLIEIVWSCLEVSWVTLCEK